MKINIYPFHTKYQKAFQMEEMQIIVALLEEQYPVWSHDKFLEVKMIISNLMIISTTNVLY